MFNLVMQYRDWEGSHGVVGRDRLFEYTSEALAAELGGATAPNLARLATLPCLFMQEGTEHQLARVGTIRNPRLSGGSITFEYYFDPDIAPLPNWRIHQNKLQFDMPSDFEFSRMHWAVKDVDLFQVLLRLAEPRRQMPTVFQLAPFEKIEPLLVSVMMPFAAEFTPVYQTIVEAAARVNLKCRRGDEIWEAPAIIQDVVNLIDRSRVVICDCTGRNANVFYEAGIAHTLGRDVILITQNKADVPFDLQHLRFVQYLNNGEGLNALADALESRLQTILRSV